MTPINEIFRTFGPEYLERYSRVMPKAHRKVIEAIIACRTEVYGIALYQCEKCGQLHRVYRSCGNAIALLVNTIKPVSGWKNRSSGNSPVITSC